MERSPESIEAANLYHSYLKGWRDGAAFRTINPQFRDHENAKIRAAYEKGYSEGRVALNEAGRVASQSYGHVPSILRRQESEGSSV